MADLTVSYPEGYGLAAVMARKGVSGGAIGNVLGLVAPKRPSWTRAGDGLALIGTGAETWLAHAAQADGFWADRLQARLGGLASVSDQSSGYAITRLAGEAARTVLQRGAAIDLDDAAFGPGAAATTVIAHIGVIVWRCEDEPGQRPVYEVATFRSYSDSFRHWLDQTVAAL